MQIPEIHIPIIEIPVNKNIKLFIKREDLIHPEISGNKYWKLFYNINNYLKKKTKTPFIITFGGAYSNHIAAVSALGKAMKIKTLGIIRGEELENKWYDNPTLSEAGKNNMQFRFVSRETYKNKEKLSQILTNEFPNALIIPEGGTNETAIKGIQHMLGNETKDFHYLCSSVGTGGTLAGISKFCEEHQKVIGFKVVNDISLENRILELSKRKNFCLEESHLGNYGKITNENIEFINAFYEKTGIPLDPIYTGKMMMQLIKMINNDYFPDNTKILAFHTGGLQGISGANKILKKQGRTTIKNNA